MTDRDLSTFHLADMHFVVQNVVLILSSLPSPSVTACRLTKFLHLMVDQHDIRSPFSMVLSPSAPLIPSFSSSRHNNLPKFTTSPTSCSRSKPQEFSLPFNAFSSPSVLATAVRPLSSTHNVGVEIVQMVHLGHDLLINLQCTLKSR